MKGIVFAEFLEMVESAFGLDVVDRMVEKARPKSGGAYAATGTYDHREIVAMVGVLSELTGRPAAELLRTFGTHLFARLVTLYPEFTRSAPDLFTFLESIDGHIHVEVRRIHPEAELPRFSCTRAPDGGTLTMHYQSPRRFFDLAQGLLLGAIAHYREPVDLVQQPIPADENARLFILTRRGRA